MYQVGVSFGGGRGNGGRAVFGRQFLIFSQIVRKRAPTRGAPTGCSRRNTENSFLSAEGREAVLQEITGPRFQKRTASPEKSRTGMAWSGKAGAARFGRAWRMSVRAGAKRHMPNPHTARPQLQSHSLAADLQQLGRSDSLCARRSCCEVCGRGLAGPAEVGNVAGSSPGSRRL